MNKILFIKTFIMIYVFGDTFMNVYLKIVVTNLWQSLKPISLMTVFWKQFGLFASMTSNTVPFLFLKQALSLTKLLNANESLRSEK